MMVYKVTVSVVDFDSLGASGIKDVIENTSYANHCIYPNVAEIEGVDIGEWDDDNPLNSFEKFDKEFKRLFSKRSKAKK